MAARRRWGTLLLGWLATASSAHATATVDESRAASLAHVEHLIRTLSPQEKVGQLLLIGVSGTKVSPNITHWVRDRRVGGIALFSRNIVNLAQTAQLARDLATMSADGVPLFIALDQEGGNVVRVKEGAMLLPSNMALGATREPTLAFVAGQGLAIDLRLLGFNMNLAPVLDVNSNPQNPVIGIRSYGERASLVGTMGAWYVRGQQEMGLVAVAKHFPGHGDTQTDSHFALPVSMADMNRLTEVEFVPFKQAIEAHLDAIMTAHIALPQVAERPDLPATLSHTVLTHVLREQMHFEGIIVTDGLEMQAIAQRYGVGRAAVMSILAGADMPMVLWSTEAKEEVYQALINAVRNGEISPKRLDASVRRILLVKARRGLFGFHNAPLEEAIGDERAARRNLMHAQVAERIAQDSLTLVRNEHDLLPLPDDGSRRVVVLAPPGPFGTRWSKVPGAVVVRVPFVPTREQRRQVAARVSALARKADVLVVGVINRYHIEIIKQVLTGVSHLPVAMVSFASPYYLKYLPEADAYVCAYSYLDAAQEAAAMGLLGQVRMTGRLPVSLPGMYPYGHRIEEHLAVKPPKSAPLSPVAPPILPAGSAGTH